MALVVPVHCGVPWFTGGYIGVELFFVLSGYLITAILLAEHESTGRIRIGAFYWRRARRLYPALLAMLAAYLALAPILAPEGQHTRDALVAGLYLSDYAMTFWKVPHYLGHTWSLAVEEHFYLLWPLVLLWMLKGRTAPWKLTAVLFLLAWLWQRHMANMGAVGFRFDTRATGLVAGCLLAMRPWTFISARVAGLAGALMLATIIALNDRPTLPFVELAGVLLVIGAQHLRGLAHPVMVWMGKLSYGIYLWHFPIAMLNPVKMHWLPTLLLVSAASILLAWLSFVTIEALFRSERRVLQVAAS
ncbi:Acyltransferase 3 [Lysobacter dokdonensis DS-58]|uniref:Acyltransferase 3 n=1 Tax=Lysobacter dokdonensis DS-58 TaxID=1300345 RepID=A0A0A2WMI0_9GAMM|nr:Acyltransferase 3 [Lysobacter dokdonensis DS-58]